jgi:hypothetical protein
MPSTQPLPACEGYYRQAREFVSEALGSLTENQGEKSLLIHGNPAAVRRLGTAKKRRQENPKHFQWNRSLGLSVVNCFQQSTTGHDSNAK